MVEYISLRTRIHKNPFLDPEGGSPYATSVVVLVVVVQQIHHKRTKICHMPTSALRCGKFVVELL